MFYLVLLLVLLVVAGQGDSAASRFIIWFIKFNLYGTLLIILFLIAFAAGMLSNFI